MRRAKTRSRRPSARVRRGLSSAAGAVAGEQHSPFARRTGASARPWAGATGAPWPGSNTAESPSGVIARQLQAQPTGKVQGCAIVGRRCRSRTGAHHRLTVPTAAVLPQEWVHDTLRSRGTGRSGRDGLPEAAKPRIVGLFLFTVRRGDAARRRPPAWRASSAVAAATALTVGGAAMLNNYLERDDRRAHGAHAAPAARPPAHPGRGARSSSGSRCGRRQPGPLGRGRRPRRPPPCAAAGAAYYVVVYTMLLKPRTPLSAVPGALAGVFPALIGWAATGAAWSGSILFLCALVFVWSPPHFWALALAREDDYIASGIPTPAVAYGERACRLLIAGFVARRDRAHAGPGRIRRLRRRLPRGRAGSRRRALGLHGAAAEAARRPRRLGAVQGHGPIPRGRRRERPCWRPSASGHDGDEPSAADLRRAIA